MWISVCRYDSGPAPAAAAPPRRCSSCPTTPPDTLLEAYAAEGWGDGLPLVAPTPGARRRHARPHRRRPRRRPGRAAAALRPGDPPPRRDQRGARRLHARRHARARHRGAGTRPARAEPPRRERHHPSGRAAARRARRDRRAGGLQRRHRRVRPGQRARTRPSGARCGSSSCTSPAPGPATATPPSTGSRRSTRTASPRTSPPVRGRRTRAVRGVDAPSAITIHCGENPHNVHDMESGTPGPILDKIATAMTTLRPEQRAASPRASTSCCSAPSTPPRSRQRDGAGATSPSTSSSAPAARGRVPRAASRAGRGGRGWSRSPTTTSLPDDRPSRQHPRARHGRRGQAQLRRARAGA